MWEKILHVGGFSNAGHYERITQEEAIQRINEGWYLWVNPAGICVKCVVATSRYGNKYIKTAADDETSNNLLSLQECIPGRALS